MDCCWLRWIWFVINMKGMSILVFYRFHRINVLTILFTLSIYLYASDNAFIIIQVIKRLLAKITKYSTSCEIKNEIDNSQNYTNKSTFCEIHEFKEIDYSRIIKRKLFSFFGFTFIGNHVTDLEIWRPW